MASNDDPSTKQALRSKAEEPATAELSDRSAEELTEEDLEQIERRWSGASFLDAARADGDLLHLSDADRAFVLNARVDVARLVAELRRLRSQSPSR